MNIFSRFWTVLKANVNAFIGRFENPERILEQSIRDMQKQVDSMRSDVIAVVAEEKKLKSELGKYQQEIARWEKNAELALKEGKEDLAREALRRKKEAAEFVQQLQPQWDQQVHIAEHLKTEFHKLRGRIESAQQKKQHLTLRLKHAETQKRLQNMLTELKSDQTFERLEGKISEAEAVTEAEMEVASLSSLEAQFDQLGSGTNADMTVEQELEAMKKRLELES
jgi:phage shock protein A